MRYTASHPLPDFFVVLIHFQNLYTARLHPFSLSVTFLPLPSQMYPSLFLFLKTLLFLPGGPRRLISWPHMHLKRCRRLLVAS